MDGAESAGIEKAVADTKLIQGEKMTLKQLILNAVVAVVAGIMLLPAILYWEITKK